ETLDFIDTILADFFTPTKANQAFPTRSQIRRKVRDICKTLDDSIAYRDTRPKDTYRFSSNGTSAWLELQVGEDTGIKLDAFIHTAAAKEGITVAEAVIKLLSGEIQPPATVVLHTYQACDIENAPTFIEGFGWRQEPMPHDKTRDLTGEVAEADGYQPGLIMRKHVEGRDGTCRVGGCEQPAFLTQLDHRHNWAEGGPTHPKNLACLCQGHHNMKTDGTLKYLLWTPTVGMLSGFSPTVPGPSTKQKAPWHPSKNGGRKQSPNTSPPPGNVCAKKPNTSNKNSTTTTHNNKPKPRPKLKVTPQRQAATTSPSKPRRFK
ncbi:HNH endonuclease signature motif containing protein, partial [Corynebacterium sp. HMSC078A10]|uniref:HNH endonuclease signature motif containing protein n=1 Tax=Corynebacterium sp. HMSC078A10 TaxID=1739312 RepID=UPI001FEF9B4D